ncbi:MAG TPA: hypothetical protein VE619_03180 [Nitrososphaeraceae archaeon]|nr:hypothetical protein [Nitrososphaeraceae archaeon]
MKKWATKVKRVINEEGRRKSINLAIVSANNHYAEFSGREEKTKEPDFGTYHSTTSASRTCI